jgi:hypothetical protein
MESVVFSRPSQDVQGEELQAIELISKNEIALEAKRGSSVACQLQESMQDIVDGTIESGNYCSEMVDTEANLYKTAILASSHMMNADFASLDHNHFQNATASDIWHAGKALVAEFENDYGMEDEDEDGAGRYFDGEAVREQQVNNYHIPIPIKPKAGSFIPPAPALAARMESGGEISLRGKVRVILRECSVSICLFGGSDFPDDKSLSLLVLQEHKFVHHRPLSSSKNAVGMTTNFVDNHFTSASAPLFPQDEYQTRMKTSKRDVDNAVEISAKNLCMIFDSFGDGACSLSLSIHDFEINDEVRISPVKKMLYHWESENLHPRYTGEDMVRFTMDISAKGGYHVRAALLPVRLVLNEDTLDLLSSFSTASDEPSSIASSPIEPLIESVDFRAMKLKIDYYPKRMNIRKIREGKYSELVHLFSYESMEVALKRVEMKNVRGFGQLAAMLTEYWSQDILNKQLYQLLAGLSPTMKNVANDMADIVLLPVDVFRGKAHTTSLGSKAQRFAKTIVVEGCGVGSKVTSAALNLLDEGRVKRVPKGMPDGFSVAANAVSLRAKSVHQTIIAVPLATWQREGTTGAMKSVIKAIPVAVIQPILGVGEAIEALSSGIRFYIEPDEFHEETRRWKN